jgi:PLP dependent protein
VANLCTICEIQTLANCQKEVCKELEIPEEQCELSMGMSADFEQAVRRPLH